MTTEQRDILIAAFKHFGFPHQMLKTFEECAELIDALSKYYQERVKSQEVISELADVSIMIEQMAMYFGYDYFLKERERKINRLNDKLQRL